jgi:poly-gamma-glutamate synthase PgsB/CapB
LGESAGSLQTTLTDWLALARERLTAPGENHLVHVALFAALALVALLARGAYVRKRIDTMRKSIPLVIGGWGTRGKSGTERLKAGVFQGLGYECLVKTTGCEAMVIHAIPGTRAREVFLYRPYDKATVWEQRDVLALAHRLEVDVFLWECMALQPDLVDLLQSQWMRDDYSTITNAYPDHEDVQGPTGYDVASVIAEFVPTGGHLFTAEDQMLPLLRDRADERGTTLRAVEEHEAEMISDELLDRFPYREHPHNIALVAALARALGVNEAVAITEMADHVVPDLGVLKTYPPLAHEGRTLVFTNGMSANERTGALSNWRRMGFDGHAPDDDPRRFIVTVVNNRADRLARSEVFARFLVDDIGAERHVLIGTNVSGLLGFLRDALAKRLERVDPTRELPPGEARLETARARLARAWAPLKVPACDAASVARELEAFGLEPLATDTIEALLMPSALEESYAEACAAIRVQLGDAFAPEARPFVVRSLARRRVTFAVRSALETWIDVDARRFARVFRAAYRELFEESLVVLDNPALTGDQVISAVAEAVPPGARVDVMGLQNIKGTGLDFVYRFVSLELVSSAVRRLASASPDVRRAALLELSAHGDYGLFDARVANDAVLAAKESDPMASALPYDDTLAHLARAIDARRSAFRSTRTTGVSRAMRLAVGRALDHLDAVRRRAMARAVVRDLASGRVRHAEAAARMRDLVARQKGAWALERP